jgi:putative phosphonate metabolism protein
MPPRYALYAIPRPDTVLARFGASWLGWDAETARPIEPARGMGLPPALHAAVTAEPRRYGFHGTLKAPFALHGDAGEAELAGAVDRFARERQPLPPVLLSLRAMGSFLALTPREPSAALNEFAAECVAAFDRFRAPPDAAELARRRRNGLSPAQGELLARWGYPYVMDEFRYHMTLTGPLDGPLRARVGEALLAPLEAILSEPLAIADLVLCVEPQPLERFRVLGRFSLRA